MVAAAVFELAIKINGSELKYFNNVHIRKSYNAPGIGGIAITQLSFNTPKPFYATRAAEVEIEGISNCGKFFISNRNLSGGIYTVNCLDRNAFLDDALGFENFDDSVKASKKVKVSDLLQKLVTDLGYSGYGGLPGWLQYIYTSELDGITYAQLLNKLADAAVGVWCCNASENLQFVPFGSYSGSAVTQKHTSLDISADHKYTGLYITNSADNTIKIGSGTHLYDCLQLESSIYDINDGYIQELQDRLLNYTTTCYSCNKALLTSNDIPELVSRVMFKQIENDTTYEYGLLTNSIDVSVTASGLYATFGYNADGQDEIATRGIITRALDNKVEYGKCGSNAVLTKFQGYMYEEEAEPGST